MARALVAALEDIKGEDIVLLDIHDIASFTDYFILCSGTSDRMLDALARSTLEKAHELANLDRIVEGKSSGGWVVLDLGDIVVHLFSPDQREYYDLEKLWERGKVLLRLQ